jgi:hypothetical protein
MESEGDAVQEGGIMILTQRIMYDAAVSSQQQLTQQWSCLQMIYGRLIKISFGKNFLKWQEYAFELHYTVTNLRS